MKDKTWVEWEAIKARAEVVNVPISEVHRNATTEGDLRSYITEIVPFIVDAESQAAA